jgi:hypothetical protein
MSNSSGGIKIPIAVKTLSDGYNQKLLLTDDPAKLELFLTRLGDPDRDLFLMHSRRCQWVAIDPLRENALGFTCKTCRRAVVHYSGEWQERIHCGCTMLVLPLELVDLVDAIDLQYWVQQIRQAEARMRAPLGPRLH